MVCPIYPGWKRDLRAETLRVPRTAHKGSVLEGVWALPVVTSVLKCGAGLWLWGLQSSEEVQGPCTEGAVKNYKDSATRGPKTQENGWGLADQTAAGSKALLCS